MIFKWLGIAGIELTLGDQVLLIDPCLTRILKWRLFFGKLHPDREQLIRYLPQADHILVTHAHYDHLLDVPELACRSGAGVYGSANACQLCLLSAVRADQVHRLHACDRLSLGSFNVTVIPARHRRIPFFTAGPLPAGLKPPFTARQYRFDACYSFRIEEGGISILVNAGSSPEQLERADVLCLHPFHSERYCRALLEKVKPGVVILNHWDDFWMPLDQPTKPAFLPPRLAIPPLKRLKMDEFGQSLMRIDPLVRVCLPERLSGYEVGSLLEGRI
jgi:L-ascorbate metabolism protein UlaG (beta-lactamase superfamily)